MAQTGQRMRPELVDAALALEDHVEELEEMERVIACDAAVSRCVMLRPHASLLYENICLESTKRVYV